MRVALRVTLLTFALFVSSLVFAEELLVAGLVLAVIAMSGAVMVRGSLGAQTKDPQVNPSTPHSAESQ